MSDSVGGGVGSFDSWAIGIIGINCFLAAILLTMGQDGLLGEEIEASLDPLTTFQNAIELIRGGFDLSLPRNPVLAIGAVPRLIITVAVNFFFLAQALFTFLVQTILFIIGFYLRFGIAGVAWAGCSVFIIGIFIFRHLTGVVEQVTRIAGALIPG